MFDHKFNNFNKNGVNQNTNNFKKIIFDLITNENGRPIPAGIVVRKLEHQINRNVIYRIIDEALKSGELKQSKTGSLIIGNIYVPPVYDKNNLLTGVISVNAANAGFITVNNDKKASYYVNKNYLNGALNGDTVEFGVLQTQSGKGDLKDACVTKVLKQGKDYYVGIFKLDDQNNYSIKIDDEKFYLEVKLDSIENLVNGQKILIQIKRVEGNIAYGSVSRIIGHVDDVGSDILSIVYDNGIEPDFPKDAFEYATNIKLNIDDYQRSIRKDLTNLPIVTIDPKTSKDFDDAIYTKKIDDNNWFLSVSIADVSHYVKFKSPLDECALTRGCSVYLVDRVIPMLPHNLSNDICSLNPNVERLTLTCDMNIDINGHISNITVYPSIIKSHRRFSYDEVNEFFNKTSNLENDTDEVKQMLLDSLELHKVLDKAKRDRGYIEFEVPEPIIIVDDKCKPIEIRRRESGTAQRMIEDFMVAANEAVTIYADSKKWPFIYRIHDKPSEERMEYFSLEAKKLGFKIDKDLSDLKSKDIARWIENNSTNKNLDLINLLLLRSMSKAKYDTVNVGHFGLALSNYTHFTSPIRRYPDLIVHRIFWMHEFERKKYSDNSLHELEDKLQDWADISSVNELRSVQCERDVNAMKFAEYMQDHIGEEFEGFVTSVAKFGMFVQLTNTVEGILKLANLKNDFYTYNEKTNELVGRKLGMRFCLGTKLKVRVISANKEIRKIEFELVKHLGNR